MIKRITPLGGLALTLAAAAAGALALALGFWLLGLIVAATVGAATLLPATFYDTQRGLDIIYDTAVYIALAGALIFAVAALTFGLDRARHQIAAAATTRSARSAPAAASAEREREVGRAE